LKEIVLHARRPQNILTGYTTRHFPLHLKKTDDLQNKIDKLVNEYSLHEEDWSCIKQPECSVEEAIKHNDDIEQLYKERESLVEILSNNNNLIKGYESQLRKVEIILERRKPAYTLEQIDVLEERRNNLQLRADTYKTQIIELENQQNPYFEVVSKLQDDLAKAQQEYKSIGIKISNLNTIIRHLTYLKKAYGDRRRIKKMLLADRIPYLNRRIKFHGDLFDPVIDLRFTNTLNIESDTWSYSECSGGEQCRINVSVMFAIHDLLLSIYGLNAKNLEPTTTLDI